MIDAGAMATAIERSRALSAVGWACVHFTWQAIVIAAALRGYWQWAGAGATRRCRAASFALGAMALLPAVTGLAIWWTATGSAVPAGGTTDTLGNGTTGAMHGAAAIGERLIAAHLAFGPAAAWIAVAWLLVCGIGALGWMRDWRAATRLARSVGLPARRRWRVALRRTARRLGVRRRVAIMASARVDSPLVIGHRRPIVLVPALAMDALGPREVEGVLAHELEHVRRADYAINLGQSLIEALLRWHPAVSWVSRLVRNEREHICDDAAIAALGAGRRGAVHYVRALARLEAARGAGRASLVMAANGGSLIDRLTRLSAGDPSRPQRSWISAVLAASALIVLGALGAVVLPGTALAVERAGDLLGRVVVRAVDPAGPFVITMRRGRVTAAEVGGAPVLPARIVQRADSVWLPWRDGTRPFVLHVARGGSGFTWTPRIP